MTMIIKSAAAAILAFGSAGAASAQMASAWSDATVRPMEITCDDLINASEAERSNMLFFIAGYQAAMEQAGQGIPSGKMTGVDTSDTADEAAQAADGSDTAGQGKATAADAEAADTAAAAGGGGTEGSTAGEVTLARAFFSKPAADVLAACEGSGGTSAAEIIRGAQGQAQ